MTTLARVLAEKKMSQTELAKRSGVARETINHLCRGTVAQTRVSIVIALAWALDMSVYELADLTYDEIPLGPRSMGDAYETLPRDWVEIYRRTGADPWIERAS
jgi:DNA-binding Xre family transcriptional regulator